MPSSRGGVGGVAVCIKSAMGLTQLLLVFQRAGSSSVMQKWTLFLFLGETPGIEEVLYKSYILRILLDL